MQGLDVETTALSPDEGDLRLVQIARNGKAQVFDMYKGEENAAVSMLLDHAEPFVAHNAVFERKWIKEKLNVDIGIIHDTLVMSRVLYTGTRAGMNPTLSHSLASCVERELKVTMDKEEQRSDWSAIKLTPEQKRYAAFDEFVLPKLAAQGA